MPRELNVNYVHANRPGSPSGDMGYGRLGVKLAAALEAEGVTVYDHLEGPIRPDGIGSEGRNAGLARSVLWVCTPPQAYGWWSTQESTILTMWEATVLPATFRENLHSFDRIIVPSQQNLELFSKYHDNVVLVPLGIDPKAWHYTPRDEPGMFFDFLIGGAGSRKGVDIAFRAFLAAFPTPAGANGIPRLFMKNHAGSKDLSMQGGDLERAFNHARVRVITGKIPDEEELSLYESCHCYLQPARGEGFGMQPLQALAQGMPTILTDAHGHESFAHLGYGLSSTLGPSDYFMYGPAGDWWEPNFDELVDRMRWVYDNYTEACADAKVAAEVIAQDFTWKQTALGILEHVNVDVPYTPGEWRESDTLKFRIRTIDTRKVDIAGRRMLLEAGKDYWDTADTKRILAEAGCLDQDCIDEEDSGLTEEQLARLGSPRPPRVNAQGDPDLTRWHAGV